MASKEIAKILITGPFSSGKTTLVKFVSEEQFSGKDVQTSDVLARYKAMTTVGLDFGILHVDDMLDVHLFGTPGQARFNFMWEILSRGALGTIFLIDSSCQRAIDEGKLMYQFFHKKQQGKDGIMPIIVGATKRDVEGARDLQELADELGMKNQTIFPCDPRDKNDSKMLVLALLQEIITQALNDDNHEDDDDDTFDLI